MKDLAKKKQTEKPILCYMAQLMGHLNYLARNIYIQVEIKEQIPLKGYGIAILKVFFVCVCVCRFFFFSSSPEWKHFYTAFGRHKEKDKQLLPPKVTTRTISTATLMILLT